MLLPIFFCFYPLKKDIASSPRLRVSAKIYLEVMSVFVWFINFDMVAIGTSRFANSVAPLRLAVCEPINSYFLRICTFPW